MESNSPEKKPKRPRIGQAFRAADDPEARPRFERPSFSNDSENGSDASDSYHQPRPYQPRPYNSQGGYNNGGQQRRPYNNQGYNRPYQQRTPYNNNNAEGTHDENGLNTGYSRPQRPYQPRTPYNNGQQRRPYNNQGYNRPYQPRAPFNNVEGAQDDNNSATGYNRPQRPYQPRPYNGNGQQRRPYNNNGGGYNNGGQRRPYNNNGNFNNRRPQNNQGFPGKGKSFVPRPKRIEYETPLPDPNEQIRLNKYMSNAGICSRREADEYIQQGLVKVNGQVVTELGTKITHSDVVEYDEKVVTPESKCYILLNKPKDCVTTSDDPNGRLTVMDLVKGACSERIYPVGRLDRNTTGVLLLTNDGDLASKLTHPKFVKKKIYHVWCDRDISEDDMQRIADGIELEDGPIHADAISYATETDRNQAGIEIHSGRNRIVRRIFESLGYHVTKLDRVYFAGLTKKNLPRGRWRYLTQEEVNYLKMGSFE